MKVLITAGGTAEPIDEVRSITNTSTGRSGVDLGTRFAKLADSTVTLLISKSGSDRFSSQLAETPQVEVKTFVTFADLAQSLKAQLASESYDLCIHMAAVSDYSVSRVQVNGVESSKTKKISSGQSITIDLAPNPKLLPQILGNSRNKDAVVVGFKLTAAAAASEIEKAVQNLFLAGGVHYVVSNDTTEIHPSQGLHKSSLWSLDKASGQPTLLRTNSNTAELFLALNSLIHATNGGLR